MTLFRTRHASAFSLLDLPADPLDVQALAALPQRTLLSLTDRVYRQLDSGHPPAYALEWYSALAGEWARRTDIDGHPKHQAHHGGMENHEEM
ncbi:hypothetical protein NNX28_15110 [Arthrobacter sp. zg-Y859]|uniref:Uncharacterized protein n=1 Tax=Arthrobacter jinronghuae TaxID=2964609 RepID=A0ABT1NU43_9MICC|nr:hypothetical protein [Arthrobacter jinronghuae]MCQ1951247.1 hypothetical protein [Arthrobacter jinronghuae]UWX78979.1 hypothetical protein N2K98_01800 [Arthrobacter jinronghuae]